MKKILIINGHPGSTNTFCNSLAEAYSKGAAESNAEVKFVNLSNMEFNPNLEFGYTRRTELEPSLIIIQQDILWADHLVLVFPVWWGSIPAKFKGLFDRAFLPGFSFKPRENSIFWDKLLSGRSARIISTMDQPGWYYRLVYGRPSVRAVKDCTLSFCGFDPVKVTLVGPVKKSTQAFRDKHILACYKLGQKQT